MTEGVDSGFSASVVNDGVSTSAGSVVGAFQLQRVLNFQSVHVQTGFSG